MKDKLTFLCLDPTGIYTTHANALAAKGKNKVYYSTNTDRAFPTLEEFAPGKDFEYLTKEDHPYDLVVEKGDEIDCICCFDSTWQGLIYLFKEIYPKLYPNHKISIFGAGLGARIEEDREGFKKILKRLGLDVGDKLNHDQKGKAGDYYIAHGIDELEELNKKHGELYIKLDKFRGTFETQKLAKYEDEVIDGTFDQMRIDLGPPFKNSQKFIVECPVKGLETGYDIFVNKTGILKKTLWGMEFKKGPYAGTTKPMPPILQNSAERMAKFLKALDYRAPFSTENILTKDGKDFLEDPTPRGPLPLSVGYPVWIKNWDEVVYKIGLNEDVNIDIRSTYVLAVPLYSAEGKESYVRIKIDPAHRKNIQFRGVCGDGKSNYFGIKGYEMMAAIVLEGNDLEKLIEQAKEEVEFAEFEGKQDYQLAILDKFPELISEAKKYNINF